MKISYNWLREYINIDMAPEKLAEIMTDLGLEIEAVEKWESVPGGLRGVIIGEVLECVKHPGADKLSLTKVNIGLAEPLSIVCGAPNVAAGQKVPVATVGTMVRSGNETFEIKRSKIRGELSEGMICAEDELGLGTSHEGIMILGSDAVPGTPASEYFKIESDTVFEIGLTPNRIYSGYHIGVARDLAAFLSVNGKEDISIKIPDVSGFKPDNKLPAPEVIIENTSDCPRYTGLTVSGVTIGESPQWLKNRLLAAGLTPINNVVDITNFVQHESGQPLHAFDAAMIEGKKVIIKNLPDKTRFVTLDGVERELSSKDLMICNQNEGMCIAGVFGGIKSGVTEKTTSIFLESAYFNPVSIRKTSKRHNLKTDAAFRFERGANPEITVWALMRAAMLIKELAGGSITSEVIDNYPAKITRKKINASFGSINRLAGKDLNKDTIRFILGKLGIIIIEDDGENLMLEIPAGMVDITCEADVTEEILRIYGYNNIEISHDLRSIISYAEKPDREKVVNIISDMLSSNGFNEIMNNSLNPASFYEKPGFMPEKLVTLANPLSTDLNAMRQSLLYGGLSSVSRNINRQNPDLRLYEFGNCYFLNNHSDKPEVKDFTEKRALDLFITGSDNPHNWNSADSTSDFFRIRSFTELVLNRLGLESVVNLSDESDKAYFSESVTYTTANELVAECGILSGEILKVFDIEQPVYYSHIEWDTVLKLIRGHEVKYSGLPKYPWVRRDLALLVDKSVRFSKIKELAFKTEKHILREVGLFDVYESDTLGKDKKSYAVSFILRDDFKTLTDKNIEKVMNNLVTVFTRELGAKIR